MRRHVKCPPWRMLLPSSSYGTLLFALLVDRPTTRCTLGSVMSVANFAANSLMNRGNGSGSGREPQSLRRDVLKMKPIQHPRLCFSFHGSLSSIVTQLDARVRTVRPCSISDASVPLVSAPPPRPPGVYQSAPRVPSSASRTGASRSLDQTALGCSARS